MKRQRRLRWKRKHRRQIRARAKLERETTNLLNETPDLFEEGIPTKGLIFHLRAADAELDEQGRVVRWGPFGQTNPENRPVMTGGSITFGTNVDGM